MSSMCSWLPAELPGGRLRGRGPTALGDAELIALLLGAGGAEEGALDSAERLLRELGGLDRLAAAGLGALTCLPGLGEAEASRILAAVELGLRIVERRDEAPGRAFCSSEEIWETYRARLANLQQEVFFAIGLNNRNEAVCEEVIAKGTSSECLVSPRDVFRPMIAEAAVRVVALHNHPSGDPAPSREDRECTNRLTAAAKILGIRVLDHVIFGSTDCFSFADAGLLAENLSLLA